MFALEYALWFDFLIPGLDRLGIPLPLGGTSNHFRTSVLRALHGWDAFNVTEDADLGMRLARKGYKVAALDTTTFEEASTHLGNWIRQRSRWLKGYMVTWLVHMRDPATFARAVGPLGFVGFQLFVGGTVFVSLANPFFWAMFVVWLLTGTHFFDAFFGPVLLVLSLGSLVVGNGLLILLAVLAPMKRHWMGLAPYGLTVIAYWVLISIAAYKALGQLVMRPFHWEKTDHGLSAFAWPADIAPERGDAA